MWNYDTHLSSLLGCATLYEFLAELIDESDLYVQEPARPAYHDPYYNHDLYR